MIRINLISFVYDTEQLKLTHHILKTGLPQQTGFFVSKKLKSSFLRAFHIKGIIFVVLRRNYTFAQNFSW